jgi:magnesium chelatase family protein
MTTTRTYTVALTGIEGHLVEVEADIARGLPATILAGLPDTALREARDRIRAAIVNSGETWPATKITVGLSPASLPKRGSGFDLAIAVAIMGANGDLPAILAGAAASLDTAVVATANLTGAGLVPGARVIAADSLSDVTAWLRGGRPPRPGIPPPVEPGPPLSRAAADRNAARKNATAERTGQEQQVGAMACRRLEPRQHSIPPP